LIDCRDIEEIHFVGSIILKKKKKGESQSLSSYPDYEIIDGQQRITTFFTFSLVLLKFLNESNPDDASLKKYINITLFI